MSEIYIIKDTGKGVINGLLPEKVVPVKVKEGGGTNNNDTYITTLSYTTEDLGVETMDEVTDELVETYINSLGLVKNENEIYCVEISQSPEPIYNFDVTGNWNLTTDNNYNSAPITDIASFKSWLESGATNSSSPNSFQDVVVSRFKLNSGRLQAIVSTSGGGTLAMSGLQIEEVKDVSIGNFEFLDLNFNKLTNFNPTNALPTGLYFLTIENNQLTDFNPTIALPSRLENLFLSHNQLTSFNTTIALPERLRSLILQGNQITDFNPTIALPEGLTNLDLQSNQITDFNPTIALPEGLRDLQLGSNSISSLNPTIALPEGLETLYLNNNLIGDFNNIMLLPIELKNLSLTGNQLTNFDSTNPLPAELMTLFLNSNLLVGFNPTIPLPSTLQLIDIQANQINNWSFSEPWAELAANQTTTLNTIANPTSSDGTTFKSILTGKGWTVNS